MSGRWMRAARVADGSIHFQLALTAVASRYLRVTMLLPPAELPRQLSLPAWIPGSYLIRDFARHLVGLEAQTTTGAPVLLTPVDQHSWQLPPTIESVVLRYRVYGNDFSVRACHIDSSHAFFNGTSVFLRLAGAESMPHDITLLAEGAPTGWQVTTALPAVRVDEQGFGVYQAENYEALIDYPVEIGTGVRREWRTAEVPHAMYWSAAHPRTDFHRIARDVAEVCQTVINFWGGAPFRRYLFLVAVDATGYGGLEHRDSTALIVPRADLPLVGEAGMTPGYQRFLSLCAHEYFHAWLVKRIRPAAFTGLPLAQPAHTRLLWLFEGFTSYFDDWLVRQAGLVTQAEYLTALAETINRAVRGKGWSRQTLEESSFYAWTRFYQQDENAVNAIVSYYTRGALLALMIDLQRRLCGYDLPTAMRQLWLRHGQKAVPEGSTIERLFQAADCPALAALLDRGLRSTDPLPFAPLLAQFGVMVEAVAEAGQARVDLGAVVGGNDPRMARVQLVFEDRPAARAGLAVGDEVIAVDGFAVGGAEFGARLARYQPGDRLVLDGFRQGRLMRWTIELEPPVLNQWQLSLMDKATLDEATIARRASWLAGA